MQQVDLDRIDLNLLKVFIALFEEQSVTGAGLRLGLAQSSLSHALNRLRVALDDPLFVRGASGMRPTPYASSLFKPISRILLELQTALDRGRAFDPAGSDRTFTVVMTDLLEMILLPELLVHLATAAPRVTLICQQMPHFQYREAFETGAVDIALGQMPSGTPDFYQQRLAVQPFSCFARLGHPLTGKLALDAFMSAQHLTVNPASMGEVAVRTALGARASQRHIVLQVPHYMVAPFILVKTDLIAVFPAALDQHFLSLGVGSMPVPFDVKHGVTYQYWHGRSHGDAGCKWLRATIHAQFQAWQAKRRAGLSCRD